MTEAKLPPITHREVLDANIRYHSQLAADYRQTQPNYKPENVRNVREKLRKISETGKRKRLIDLGCGTGFIPEIAHPFFQHVFGLDATEAMLKQAPGDFENVHYCLGDTSRLPFRDSVCDVCTAYAVLHHILDIRAFFQEAYRILDNRGTLYTDLDPNYYYWEKLHHLSDGDIDHPVIQREIRSVVTKNEEISEESGLDLNTIELAEFHKMVHHGFQEDTICTMLTGIGFTEIEYRYEWFLGEAPYLHEKQADRPAVQRYLEDHLPATRDLFKYVSIIARKP